MRIVVLLILLAAAGGYYWKDQREISEAKVMRYVRAHVDAMQRKDAEALCEQLAPDFEGQFLHVVAGAVQQQHIDREQSCENMRQFFEAKAAMDHTLPAGSEFGVNFAINIDRVEISDDKKHATTQTRSRLSFANAVIIDSVTTDTFGMLDGSVVMQSSEGRVQVSGPAAGTMR